MRCSPQVYADLLIYHSKGDYFLLKTCANMNSSHLKYNNKTLRDSKAQASEKVICAKRIMLMRQTIM